MLVSFTITVLEICLVRYNRGRKIEQLRYTSMYASRKYAVVQLLFTMWYSRFCFISSYVQIGLYFQIFISATVAAADAAADAAAAAAAQALFGWATCSV